MPFWDKLLGKRTEVVFQGNPLPPSQTEVEKLVAEDILRSRLKMRKIASPAAAVAEEIVEPVAPAEPEPTAEPRVKQIALTENFREFRRKHPNATEAEIMAWVERQGGD